MSEKSNSRQLIKQAPNRQATIFNGSRNALPNSVFNPKTTLFKS